MNLFPNPAVSPQASTKFEESSLKLKPLKSLLKEFLSSFLEKSIEHECSREFTSEREWSEKSSTKRPVLNI